MAFIEDYKAKFENLDVSLKHQSRSQLKREANGGNSIIFTYSPIEEQLYLLKAEELLDTSRFRFINIAELLVKFIDNDGWKDFKSYYQDFADTPHLVFKSDDEETDLMDLIINEISEANNADLIPVLIRTGSLFGTGIENVNIMEHSLVMELKHPLIIFYPSKVENGSLYFLNIKSASRYRCTIID